jgi:hypothetical protein
MNLTSLRIERAAIRIPGGTVMTVEFIEPGVARFREPPAGIKLVHIKIHDVVDALAIENVKGVDYSLFHIIEEVSEVDVPMAVIHAFADLGAGHLKTYRQKGVVEHEYPLNMYWAIDRT